MSTLTAAAETEAATEHRIRTRRAFIAVLVASLAALIVKGWIASHTTGTDDVATLARFARAIGRVGPIRVYELRFSPHYNHPPLTGWMLWLLNGFARHGPSFRFLVRAVSSVADMGTGLIVFDVLRKHRGLRAASIGGIGVALSPVLVAISGFHGNIDPIFIFFTLLAFWLLIEHGLAATAGAAIAAAAAIKILPLIVVPALIVLTARRKRLLPFVVGFVAISAALWLPVAVREGRLARVAVFGYKGQVGPWGLEELLKLVRAPAWIGRTLNRSSTFLAAAVSASAAWIAWRRHGDDYAAAAIAFILVLAMLPAFAPQYLVWPVAVLFLVDSGLAIAYSLVAGTALIHLYTVWSQGFPWDWAHPRPVHGWFYPATLFLAWLILLIASAAALGLTRVRETRFAAPRSA